MRIVSTLAVLLGLIVTNVQADVAQTISDKLAELAPDMRVAEVSESPIQGLHQVILQSGGVIYVTADGNHLIQGTLFDIAAMPPRNLTAQAEAAINIEALATLDEEDLVVFSAPEAKTQITVFTDVDCGYCRKLHEEIDQLTALGVEVRYAAFVRAGPGSQTAATMESIWCAEDRQQAMTLAKRGEAIARASCDTPIEAQQALGSRLGVRGTPAIFFANGVMLPGYKPAQALAAEALANTP